GVLQHAEDLGLERLDARPVHDGPPVSLHAHADVVHLPVRAGFRPDVHRSSANAAEKTGNKNANAKEGEAGGKLHSESPKPGSRAMVQPKAIVVRLPSSRVHLCFRDWHTLRR